MEKIFKYFLINKPYGMICQFTKEGDHPTLADLNYTFPKDVYSVGRLDTDSEGLLLLTNDNKLKTKLLLPENHYKKCYWVQVEGEISELALQQLTNGVEINNNGKLYTTQKAVAVKLNADDICKIKARNPPIRKREKIPTTWISITLTEGKNRQVRKMTAKTGFPTLRLIRWSIEDLTIELLKNEDVIEIQCPIFFKGKAH